MSNSLPPSSAHTLFPGISENFHYLAYPGNLLVWMSDARGLCTFVSPSWTTFTGRQLSEELGNGWLDRVHENDREALILGLHNGCRSAAGKQQPFRLMFRYLRQDGMYRWLMSQGMPHSSPNNEFVGYLSLCFDVTPYQEGEAEMERSIQDVFPLLQQTRLIAVILDAQGRVQFSNGSLCRLLKCGGRTLLNCNLFEQHLAGNDRDLLNTLYPGGQQNTNYPTQFQSELLSTDNISCHVSWHSVIWRDYAGRAKGAMLIGDDLTKLIHEEKQTSIYIKAFEATDNAIIVTEVDGTIISANQAFTDLTGYSREEVLGKNPRILQSGQHDQAFYKQMWDTLLNTGHWRGDLWDRRKDGVIYPKFMAISAIKSSAGELTNFVGIFYDNSERKTVEERLEHLAHYDSLTGLPNRSLLLDRLEQGIERAKRLNTKVAMLFLDLDHFKLINDVHGHGAGDELLKTAAHRMKICVRGIDTVARLGGDEFVVLVPDSSGIEDTRTIACKLLEALSPPYEIEGHAVICTPSIGISIYPDDGMTAQKLLKHADEAMYQAKQAGRANFRFYNEAAPNQTT
jgi:diguanylate cyclase (GGDEF)-like protein/PAS domain S-box-containing protein